MTTMTEPTTRTVDAPGATLTYDVRTDRLADAPVLFLIGSPMGAGGFGTLAGALHRSHGRDLRPSRRRAQHEGRSGQPVHARAARRRRAPDHHRARRRPGRPLRQQRWRGQRARPRREATRTTSGRSSRTSHRSPSILPDREGAMAACQAIADTYQRDGFGAGMAQFIGVVSHQGPIGAGVRRQPAPDPAMFGMPAEDDGNRTDPLLGQNIIDLHPLRARLRGAACGLRRGSCWPPAWSPRARWRAAARSPRHERLGIEPFASRATTAASSAASTARPATPTPSPQSCARSSPRAEPRPAGRTTHGGPTRSTTDPASRSARSPSSTTSRGPRRSSRSRRPTSWRSIAARSSRP